MSHIVQKRGRNMFHIRTDFLFWQADEHCFTPTAYIAVPGRSVGSKSWHRRITVHIFTLGNFDDYIICSFQQLHRRLLEQQTEPPYVSAVFGSPLPSAAAPPPTVVFFRVFRAFSRWKISRSGDVPDLDGRK